MMLQKALEFLQNHKEVALATCEGGFSFLRQFQIMKQDGVTLYFATSREKEVYRQLKANPHVALMAMADKVTVRCAGTAMFDVDASTQLWIYENNPVLQRLYSSYETLVYFRLSIDRIDYYDLRPTPPVSLHFDLTTGFQTTGFVGERFQGKD